MGDAMPSTIGAGIGKIGYMTIAGSSFYDYGMGQGFGRLTNDFGSFIFTGGTAAPMGTLIENTTGKNLFIYESTTFGYTYGSY